MKLRVSIAILVLIANIGFSQKIDTLNLTLPDAEAMFIKNNLTLLAQKYNIEATKAGILQAKLFPNPNVNIEQTMHAKRAVANNDIINPFGQRALQVQQLFLMAGKRNKMIRIQELNTEISEYQFNELIRELIFQLRSNYYQIYFSQKSLSMYASEIATMNRLVNAYQEQYLKGNIPYKEVVRLFSFLLTLESEQSKLNTQILDAQMSIKVLLGESNSSFIKTFIDESQTDKLSVNNINLESLYQVANENRFDQKMQEANVRLAQANLAFQKALAKPDLTVGYTYDRAGSYINNYNAFTLSMPIPLFNKNQGNIKMAENQIKANQSSFNQSKLIVENDVLNSYAKALKLEKLYRTFDKDFVKNYEKLINGVIENYQKRNISLIEFTDFIESYKNAVTQINSLQNDRMQAYELINFATGQKIL